MSLNFFRRVGFGINPRQDVPSDPLEWSKAQVDNVPAYDWPNHIPSTKDGLNIMIKEHQDKEKIRSKFKGDKVGFHNASKSIRKPFRDNDEANIKIRFNEVLKSGSPFFERLVMFWGNHFAIIDKGDLASVITGPYQREVIRKNLTGNIEHLTREATISWAMIEALDNRESIAPNSLKAKKDRKKGKTPTLNENHARELLELHTVSPQANYSQQDVINTAYILAGWRQKWSKKRRFYNVVEFDPDFHEPGEHFVLGKGYKQRNLNSKTKLFDLIADLVRHPNCIEFISRKLCCHFVADKPTAEMIAPIIKTWKITDGDLPSIHKTLLEVSFQHCSNTKKFQNPEVWFYQVLNMSGTNVIDYLDIITVIRELGHHPFKPLQPNGWPDTEAEWLSPEMLIRRLSVSKYILANRAKYNISKDLNIETLVLKNFDQSKDILKWLSDFEFNKQKLTRLYPSEWMLYS